MPKENNKMQVDIDTLKKQNVNDLLSIKELYKRIEELGEKITQIKYIDNTLVKKIKKEYEKLNKIILDENIQVQLVNKIDELKNNVNDNNSQLDKIVPLYLSKDFFKLPYSIQERLETILNNENINEIVFPYDLTITLEKQLIIKRDNLKINFNNCLFQFPNSYAANTRYEYGKSVGCNIITFIDSNNIQIENLKINGNRKSYNGSDTTNDKWQVGIYLNNVKNFKLKSFECYEINYHALVVYNGVNCIFNNLILNNNGCCGGNGGYSDVYTFDDDSVYSSLTFQNIYSKRDDLLADNTGQLFYINSESTIINNIVGINISSPFDFRKGEHIVKDVFVKGARGLTVGTYPQNKTFPKITMENINLIDLIGNDSGGALLYVTACDKLNIKNINLSSIDNYSYYYGVLIKKGASGAPINDLKNIIIENISIDLKKVEGRNIMFESIIEPIYIKNLNILSNKGHNAIRSSNCNTDIFIENYKSSGVYTIEVESLDKKVKIKNQPTFGNGVPNFKPSFIGQDYLDLTNKKKYISFGNSNISDWVVI